LSRSGRSGAVSGCDYAAVIQPYAKIETTLGIYAHALPSMQQDAAAKLAALCFTAEGIAS
jgi:hypothetical protein